MAPKYEAAAERRRRRADPAEAEVALRRLIPSDALRSGVLQLFGRTITEAMAVGSAAWEVTLEFRRPFVRLNMGQIYVFSIEPEVVLLSLAVGELSKTGKDQLRGVAGRGEKFKILPEIRSFQVPHAALPDLWPTVLAAHVTALKLAGGNHRSSPFAASHSPGVVEYVSQQLGDRLPQPSYPEGEGLRRAIDKMVSLVQEKYPGWASFDDPRFVADEREYKADSIAKAQELLNKEALSGLLARGESDEFVRRLDVLGKDNNLLFRGVPRQGDLGVLYQPELDKNAFSRQVLDLLYGDGETAARLDRYVAYVAGAGLRNKWVFPTYFLWLCHPGSEVFVKPGAAKAILELVGSELTLEATPSGSAYLEYRDLIAELKDGLAAYQPRDMTDVQGFLWIVHRGLGEEGTSYWKIAPGEGAREWEAWKAESYIAIGWSELGDLSGADREEFDRRREAVAVKHPDWTKTALDQVWKFSQMKQGDRIVANRGTQEVLGLGTVVGSYYYVPSDDLGHRLPVTWDDTTLRQVDESGWKRTLIEIDAEKFESIAHPSPTPGAPPGVEPLPGGPAFSREAFALLAELTETPTREFYLARKEEFGALVEEPFQKLLDAVAAKLPESARQELETEKNIFARILKNDWGRGGAWPFYWGALYPKEGRRVEDAQLYVLMNADSLRFGFGMGRQGSQQQQRLIENWRREKTYLSSYFDEELGQLSFGTRGVAPGAPTPTASAKEWLANPEDVGIQIDTLLSIDAVLSLSFEQLRDRIVDVFDRLFPMVLFSTEVDPIPAVQAYRGVGIDPAPSNPPYSLELWASETAFDETELKRWVQAMNRKGQVILYGPPGTGKTYMAQRFARHITAGGDGFIDLVQFHPSYAYEDFMQGIRPKATANGGLTYEMAPGRFLEFCQRASRCTGVCVLIIDEINRANLSRVLGELMYLLEYRNDKTDIPLAGGARFRVPSNVRIIGTMNTADRSIALVDHALRRRFAFLEIQPNYEVLRRFHGTHNPDFRIDALVEALKSVNQAVGNPHYELGISFFMREDLPLQIEDIWRMEIEPYLVEYFFDQESKVGDHRWAKVRSRLE